MSPPKRVALLGSTGSIGRQTLDVVALHPDRFRVVALACRRSSEEIVAQARRFHPSFVAVADEASAAEVASALSDMDLKVAAGQEAMVQCATHAEADITVAAAAGVAGLIPVWEAVKAGKRLALANKEPLVVAGHLITAEAAKSGAQLLPVDSEHSAIFQSLLGQRRDAIAKVTLTASGGAFRDLSTDELARVTPTDALAHPTWQMGAKVTIDSATLMNKGLELIEARWLFALAPEMLEVVLHRESIIHSFIEFVDGSVLAHLAQPDMRVPIQFALSYPERLSRPEPAPDFAALGALHFAPFESARWPCVALAREAMSRGGTTPAALNAADEIAVAWFLSERIPFPAIAEIVEFALENHTPTAGDSLEELLDTDRLVRDLVERNAQKWIRSVT
ncbi:MAG: 1-deoxy-D-xylulose-5-phosphate reductoisomerase [Armatimonadetes bacterium]|nr:1-deoxy-D-xylulose-5-phosphate reductoisomerase [Armatimonadota bacterium]